MKKIFATFLSILFLFFLIPSKAYADESLGCDNRFLTIVNPVRGRKLWGVKSLDPIKDQYGLIEERDLEATWLLQYDAIADKELASYVKTFDEKQEQGVFLEISEDLATDAGVIYPHATAWANPKAVFLSGYSQSDRKKLIDTVVSRFKEEFEYYPSSVGAWWIDSYSLNYLKEKYGVKIAMIVADQKTTDNYGVWGQWWGVPYYPSKANILTPANSLNEREDVVIVQWAQRDLTKAYDEGFIHSNYSLQANDYIKQEKDTNYFTSLVKDYLSCDNPLGQVTLGLETGIESVSYFDEYRNQLDAMVELKDLNIVKLSDFSEKFKEAFPVLVGGYTLTDGFSTWKLDRIHRENEFLGDYVNYNQNLAFSDYFLADNSDFLDRRLPVDGKGGGRSLPWFLIVYIAALVWAYKKRRMQDWVIATLFSAASFGLILLSFTQYGWHVFFSSSFENPAFTQALLAVASFVYIFWLAGYAKKRRSFLWFIPLSFGIDPIIKALRLTIISGSYYIGFVVDKLHFNALEFSKWRVEFISQELPHAQAAALLKFDFSDIWQNPLLSIVVYPAFHILLAFGLSLFFKKLPKKGKYILVSLFIVLLIWHMIGILAADPVTIVSIK